jgi:hypothetical protein
MRVNSGLASKNTNPLASLASYFSPRLTYPFYIFGQLFSDLANTNTDLLTRLTIALKKLFTPLENKRKEM